MFKVDAALIRDELFKRQMTAKELAESVGINAITMARLLRDGAKTQAKIVGKLAAFFGLRGDDLILKERLGD